MDAQCWSQLFHQLSQDSSLENSAIVYCDIGALHLTYLTLQNRCKLYLQEILPFAIAKDQNMTSGSHVKTSKQNLKPVKSHMSKQLLHCLKQVNKRNFLLLFHKDLNKQSFETQDFTLQKQESHASFRALLFVVRNSTKQIKDMALY